MESLLRWSIENSTPLDNAPTDQPPAQRQDLDPAIIDTILGKPDAEAMKEDLAVAVDDTRSETDRVDALDHLEMLIEQIDNANNLENLKMWDPLQSLLTSPTSTSPIKTHALWIIGTALQNNPAAQDAYLTRKPLATLTSLLSPSATPSIRSKAIYALSGLLKHNSPAVEALGKDEENDGWGKLRDALQDPDITVRRKTAFLLNTLLTPTFTTTSPTAPSLSSESLSSPSLHTPSAPSQPQPIYPNSHASHLSNPSKTSTSLLTLSALHKHNILPALIDALVNPVPWGEDGDQDGEGEGDVDFVEKAVRLLSTYALQCNGEFSPTEKEALRGWLEKEKSKGGEALSERLGLSVEELRGLREHC